MIEEKFHFFYARFRLILCLFALAAGLLSLCSFKNTCIEEIDLGGGSLIAHPVDIHIPTAEEIYKMMEEERDDGYAEELREAIKEIMGYEGDGEFV